ncbi:MAG: hypothetical protein ACKO5E_14815 [bacterium]
MRERTQSQVLTADFLEIRQRILDLAAMLDRYDAANTEPGRETDTRLTQIREGLKALGESGSSRAEAVQQIFSLPYDQNWLDRFELKKRF